MPDYILKLKALLHDPVHKIWSFSNVQDADFYHKEVLSKNLKKHEKVALDLFNFLLKEDLDDVRVNHADIIASGLSRVLISPDGGDEEIRKQFEEQNSVFVKDAKFIDFLRGNECAIGIPKSNDEVMDIFKKLGKLNFSSQEERAKYYFLFLWRFLPEIFPWINTHPADSRVPNHSIYDHIVQSAAIATCIEDSDYPSFLLFTLGPVQDFIAKAKKTSDLWAGSFILSYLTYAAIEVIIDEIGPDHVIFPNLLKQPFVDRWLYNKLHNQNIDSECFKNWKENWQKQLQKEQNNDKPFDDILTIANIPNRLLAIVPYCKAKELAQNCKNAITKKIDNFVETMPNQYTAIVKEQLYSYFNIYYVIMPWKAKNNDDNIQNIIDTYKHFIEVEDLVKVVDTIKQYPYYKNVSSGITYSLLVEITERFLAARKNIRDFINIPAQKGKKCKLCGEYTAIVKDFEDELCGVCYLKRKLPDIMKDELQLKEAVRYPSTSELPTVQYKLSIKENVVHELKEKLETIDKSLTKKFVSVPKLKGKSLYNMDGQFLMQGTYRKEYMKQEIGLDVDESKLEDVKNFLKKNSISPPVYYAILSMDGDEIGNWLNGKQMIPIKELMHAESKKALQHFWDKDKINDLHTILNSPHPMSPSFHNGFSRRLSYFALEEVKKIVENTYYGKLIYAGGDDVMAFLPVKDAVDCANELQNAFKTVLCNNATMSAGIVYVHHKYPLAFALNEVRTAEKLAKDKYGRNACCIKLLKNSGEKRITGFKWGGSDEISHQRFFNTIIKLYRDDKLSSKFAYDFMNIVEELKYSPEDSSLKQSNVKQIVKSELKRIYSHKQSKENKNNAFLQQMLSVFDSWEYEYQDFANIFIIARFISKEGREII